jgi:Cu/Ag efflux pump CusA
VGERHGGLVSLATAASLIPLTLGADPDQLFGAIALATLGGTIAATAAALWVLPALITRRAAGAPAAG